MSKIIKHGLDYIFNNNEYIKIDPLYQDQYWFTETPYKIKSFNKKSRTKPISDYYELYSNV